MPSLATNLFDYDLPPHLVAQIPSARRDASRLLTVERRTGRITHHLFADLPQFLQAGDTLIRNTAAVLPARLSARRPTGGQVECFLLRPVDGNEIWRCLIKPGKKLPVGATFAHESGAFSGEIVAKESDGSALVRLKTPDQAPIITVANRLGAVPLPPYITREDGSMQALDRERYQTVYADHSRQVAVAAPTAGLHFTPELLQRLTLDGIMTADVTLHIGLGTFKPITTDFIEAHEIHRELYEIPAATQKSLFAPGVGRRVAVGTTSVRCMEDFLANHDSPTPAACYAEASLFIHPPRTFRGVDSLITNFHQPRSTLLCLVSAFLTPGSTDGIAWLKEIYAEAIAREYRFYSYGDAMLIL